MIHKSIKRLINLIISHNWEGKLRIDNLIIEIIENNFSDEEVDDLIDKYADTKTSQFSKLINAINLTNKDNDFQKIILEEKYDGYYIQKKLNDENVSRKYDEVIKIIDKIGNPSESKGVLYEKFCKLFLIDLGINSELTRASNDKGIDILGKFKANLPDEIGKLVFSDDIYLLVQTKYTDRKIDTPVIRKLVGDSLFIRFDELDYIEIKHNAFHLVVFSHSGFTQPAIDFAKKNKIKLFDSVKIAHIISEKPEKQWDCLAILQG
jgi:HJR/Mrr/RecB family endonuclease